MIQLRNNTAGRTTPANLKCRLQITIVSAVLNGSAGRCPLTDNTTGIMRTITIYRTKVDAFLNRPVISGGGILVSDDSTGKTVRLTIFSFCR